MLLADIGNRHIHIFDGEQVEHMGTQEAISKYGDKELKYISVRKGIAQEFYACHKWTDISKNIHIDGEYEGMGVDRRALCLSRGDGIYVDAGSAITVDKVSGGKYVGGYLLPGIHAYRKAFAQISPVLDREIDRDMELITLPSDTQQGISYGIISSIISSIDKIRDDLPIYCTGGDGEWIASYLNGAVFDERLVFEGLANALRLPKVVDSM